MMHFAKLAESPRLQRTAAALADGAWHSTRELIAEANVCAVNSIIAELRANGLDVETRCAGVGRYEYRLVCGGAAPAQAVKRDSPPTGTPVQPPPICADLFSTVAMGVCR